MIIALITATIYTVGYAYYQHTAQTKSLSDINSFLKQHAVELKQSFPTISETYSSTSSSGVLRITYIREIDEEKVRSWVASRLPSIRIQFVRIDS